MNYTLEQVFWLLPK